MIENERSRPIQKLFFVSPEENFLIQKRMMEAKTENFSFFARCMLLDGEIKVFNFEEIKNLRMAINRIGHNINQIAKQVNTDEQANLETLTSVLQVMNEIKQLAEQSISLAEQKE